MRFVFFLFAVAGVATVVQPAGAQPQIPATYFGSASLDGAPPPEGSAVRGYVDGLDCTQPGALGTVVDGGVGAYVIEVMHESQKPGCGKPGKTATFTVAGRLAGQQAAWQAGPNRLDLNAGRGAPVPLPTPAATAAPAVGATTTSLGGTATAAVGAVTPLPRPSVLPTDDVRLPLTPRPPGFGSVSRAPAADQGGDFPAWAVVVLAFGGVALGGGVSGYWLSRRRRPPRPPTPP
ncbi:MAG: hypothetical protein IT304_08690 [Dehalococcoidia bacterium]|nr:hypothetical protein [Dehalococcoidia bacterium]